MSEISLSAAASRLESVRVDMEIVRDLLDVVYQGLYERRECDETDMHRPYQTPIVIGYATARDSVLKIEEIHDQLYAASRAQEANADQKANDKQKTKKD